MYTQISRLPALVILAAVTVLVTGCSSKKSPQENCSTVLPEAETQPPSQGETQPSSSQPEQSKLTEASSLPAPDMSSFEWAIREQVADMRAKAQASPPDDKAIGLLGMLYQAYGLSAPAEECYRQALSLNPNAFRWNYYLGHVLLDQGKYAEATLPLLKATELEPSYAPARIIHAIANLHAGDPDAAIRYGTELHEEYPEDPMIAYILGMSYKMLEQPVWAVEYLKPLLDKYPHLGRVRAALADSFRNLGQEEKATELLEGWTPNDDLPTLRDPMLAEIYRYTTGTDAELRKARAYSEIGAYKRALAHYDLALKYSPDSIPARGGRADMLIYLGMHKEAKEELLTILQSGMKNPEVLERLAETHLALGDVAEAQRIVTELAAAGRDNRRLLSLQVQLASLEKEYETAVGFMSKIVASQPDDPAALCVLGRLQRLAGHLDVAQATLQQALMIAPTSIEIMSEMAELCAARGNEEASRNWLRKMELAGGQGASEALLSAGAALDEMDYKKAEGILTKALQADPADVAVADMLSRIYSMCPDPQLRDGHKALRIAMDAYGANEDNTPIHGLNTLAAGYAEVGEFEEAVRLTYLVVTKARDAGDIEMLNRAKSNLRVYERRLCLYEQ